MRGPQIDLTKVIVPVLAINGELDRPHYKTARMSRELMNFTNVVLPGKSHLTAIVAGTIPQLYIDSLEGSSIRTTSRNQKQLRSGQAGIDGGPCLNAKRRRLPPAPFLLTVKSATPLQENPSASRAVL